MKITDFILLFYSNFCTFTHDEKCSLYSCLIVLSAIALICLAHSNKNPLIYFFIVKLNTNIPHKTSNEKNITFVLCFWKL